MAYKLLRGQEPRERVEALLELTRIRSEPIRDAIFAHLVNGRSIRDVCYFQEVPRQNFSRALSRLERSARIVERIKEIDTKSNQLTD